MKFEGCVVNMYFNVNSQIFILRLEDFWRIASAVQVSLYLHSEREVQVEEGADFCDGP